MSGSKKLEPIFNGCGIESQDSMCTDLQDTECPNRSDDGATCTDCLVDCEAEQIIYVNDDAWTADEPQSWW
jgi:hypothetical protein